MQSDEKAVHLVNVLKEFQKKMEEMKVEQMVLTDRIKGAINNGKIKKVREKLKLIK